jgi:hypothetical protein
MELSIYLSNSSSFMPPFSFMPIVHGHTLSSSQPNLPRVLETWRRKSNRSFSQSSDVAAVGSCQCIGTHSPAALLPKMPVQLREAADLCVSGK